MGGSRFSSSAIVGAALAAAALLLGGVAPASAAGPCSGAVMYIAAHEDDTLLFQSPDLLEDVRANKCVRTVFTTAGDAGKTGEGGKYWKGREAGAQAGYAEMAGVANTWAGSTLTANGHSIHLETLNGQPGISIAYLRLPDGGPDGKGFPLPGGGPSLTKLWRDGHGEMPAIAEISPLDGAAGYTYEGLVNTLEALVEGFGAQTIATQSYPNPLVGIDHSDHVVTGKFVRVAQESYAPAHLLIGYEGYETYIPPLAEQPANISGELLTGKQEAFAAYTPHDEACGTDEDCEASPYPQWLERQYVAAEESTPGAVVGQAQSVVPGAAVKLDGSASFDPGGLPLQYEWKQTAGPKVTLSGATTATPSFTAPATPTTLTFALVVENGTRESLPAGVTITVANPPSPPPPNQGSGSGEPPFKAPPKGIVVKKLSREKLRLVVGRKSRNLIKVIAPSKSAVKCRGTLPKGARCKVTADKDIVIEGSKSVKKAGTFHLVIYVAGGAGAFLRPLTVVFRRT
jgi:LmbE family N-acetylglucosaminyl deacetylase